MLAGPDVSKPAEADEAGFCTRGQPSSAVRDVL